jgi:hypothetical protein
VSTELEVLRLVSDRLAALKLPFMLTGSFAMAHYVTPRMTRDLDLVVALSAQDAQRLVGAFSVDFHVDPDEVSAAILSRRKQAKIGDVSTWIASREDLILSKLVWALSANSELQRRDARQLLESGVDSAYLLRWAPALGVATLLKELQP